MATSYPINPMYLLGKTFDFIEVPSLDVPPIRYVGEVLAVLVPAPFSSVDWSLLIRQHGRSDPDFVELDSLHFEWPIPGPV